ncbi:acetyl-CoA C-acyltransferase [Hyphococcus sp. DH-69]|uniref:acetyl-CoA C-acyltransferase n=1 Tax=Hyphococcus formosus TaxID=3143534 RepID=UPI00398A9179
MEVFVYDAVRSPRGRGRADGSMAEVRPPILVSQLIDGLRQRNAGALVDKIDSFTLSCVTQIGAQGGHIAVASKLLSDLPSNVAPLSINNFCVGGLSAIAAGARRILSGENELVISGGVESMSQVGFLTDEANFYTDMTLADRMGWAPVGVGADLLANVEGISAADMDFFTLRSNQLAAKAWAEKRFDNRVLAIKNDDGSIALDHDENIRDHGDGSKLSSLEPVFQSMGEAGFDDIILSKMPDLSSLEHRHSIAHCPPIADGAGLALLGTQGAGESLGIKPIAKIIAFAETADSPLLQLTAGFRAMDAVLKKANMQLSDMDAIEFMEAFAVTPVKFMRDYEPDLDRVNVNGGHLAMGHPMGATGAILFGALLDSLDHLDGEIGLVVTTGGVGVGAAAIVQRL